jgi:hypothetical protein
MAAVLPSGEIVIDEGIDARAPQAWDTLADPADTAQNPQDLGCVRVRGEGDGVPGGGRERPAPAHDLRFW